MIRLYIAGPMGSEPVRRRALVHAASRIGVELVKQGFAVYLPHLWDLADGAELVEYERWIAMDLEWVSSCHAVLRIPGDSPGANREVERARTLGIPVMGSIDEVCRFFADGRCGVSGPPMGDAA